jgi:hypothetical protein
MVPLRDLMGLAPTRGFIGRRHWATHTSKTMNIIHSPTTLHDVTIVTTAAAHLFCYYYYCYYYYYYYYYYFQYYHFVTACQSLYTYLWMM